MKLVKTLVALAFAGGLSACASVDTASRGNADFKAPVVPTEMIVQSAQWNVIDVRVTVPSDLKVSEANRYYPVADIVWRGDAYGDRYQQVAAIMDEGLTNGVKAMQGPRPVYFDITMKRFHSLTEKARYSVGGVHNIIYDLVVVDAATGQPLHGPVEIELDLKAYGGEQAFEAERRGHTQKVRILSHLATTIRRQFPTAATVQVSRAASILTDGPLVGAVAEDLVPEGYEPARR